MKEKTHTAPQLQNRVGRTVENTSNPCYAPAKGLATGTVNAIDNLAKGVGTTILHPVETVKNVATAVTNPIDTTKAIAQDIKQTIDEKIIDGDTQSRFEVIGEVATSALLGATVASAVKAGSVVSKVDEVTDMNKVATGIEGGSISLIDIDEIRPKLKTEPDTAFFWSGRTDGIGGADNAANIAKSRGGVTLESTIASQNITMPEWDFNNPSTMEAWDLASGAAESI